MPPDSFSVNLPRGRRFLLPALVFLICFQLLLLQIVLALEAGEQNQTVKQVQDTNTALASPNVNLNKPVILNPTPVQSYSIQPEASPSHSEELNTGASIPPIPRDEILYSVPAAGKRVALTFDDGPAFRYTMEYLKVLRENQVPATFFLVGRRIQCNPSLVSMIVGEGHEIGNHSYDHPNLELQREAAIKEQLSRTSDLLSQWTQKEIKLMRPPGGAFGPGLLKVASEMNLRVVMWTIDPRDWEKNKTSNEIATLIKKNMEPGAIILLHEGKPQTLAALPILINDLQKDGWEFVTISGLIGEDN